MNELSSLQDGVVLAVFAVVYLGMVLGRLPWLHLDRTGVALLGAIAIVGAGVMTPEQAAHSIHLPTILLLFSFMVISAQMRLGGFYSAVTRRIAVLPVGPAALMGVVSGVAAGLSAVFSNDIVCLAVAPVLAGLLALWALLAWQMRRTPPVAEPDPARLAAIASEVPPVDR